MTNLAFHLFHGELIVDFDFLQILFLILYLTLVLFVDVIVSAPGAQLVAFVDRGMQRKAFSKSA